VHDVDDRSGEWSGVKTERMEWLNWNVDMLVRCLAETAMWYSTHTRPVDRSTTSSTTGWSVTRTCTLHRVYLYTGCTCTQGVLVHRVYLYTGCTCTQGVLVHRVFQNPWTRAPHRLLLAGLSLGLVHYTGCFQNKVVP